MENNLPVALTQKPKKINDGQKALLKLICQKFESGESLDKGEAMVIYKEKVQRSKYTWGFYPDPSNNGKWINGRHEYTEYELDFNMTNWLLRALGVLIQKGYLTVIPKINFSNPILLEKD